LRNELLRFFVQKRCLKLAAKDDDTVVIDPTVPFETAGVWVHRFNDRSSLYFGSSYWKTATRGNDEKKWNKATITRISGRPM
jgi:hypothetical protein